MNSRRRFLRNAGWLAGGITVFAVQGCSVIPPLPTFSASENDDVFTWVQLLPSGQIRYYLSRAEMGQGISTGLSQVVAEELNVPVSAIDCRYQSTLVMAACQMTVGSQSIENYLQLTAKSAAYLRHSLRLRAATKLAVDAMTLQSIRSGFRSRSGQTIAYINLLDSKDEVIRALPTDLDIELFSERKSSDLIVVGKKVEPVRIRRIVTGGETYSRDVQVAGMRFGEIVKPPQLGASIKSYTKKNALSIDGVLDVVVEKDQIGIVAMTPMAVSAGLKALDVQWQALTKSQLANVQRSLDIDEFVSQRKLDHVAGKSGSVSSAKKQAQQTLSLRYDSPMVAHAAMEPRCGVANYRMNEFGHATCDVWTGCQDAWLVRSAVAKALRLKEERVQVHNLRIGGAFGGRVLCQAALEAAWLSKAIQQPVKVQWSREDEFRYNYVGPQFSSRIAAGLNSSGQITHWFHQSLGAPILTSSMFIPPYLHWAANFVADPGTRRGTELPYAIENHRLEFADERIPMPTGPWRGLGAAPNTFAMESAMDELATAAGVDPITFRLNHLKEKRLAACLIRLQNLVGDRVNNMGIAVAIYKGVTFVATAIAMEMVAGQPRVKQAICVHDCGRVISPDQVRAQIEGNVIWGIGMALLERYELAKGIAGARNFDRYTIARQVHVPEIEIDLLESEAAASGAGEAALAPVAAAIANGVFNLTGKRHRRLPIVAS